MAKEQLIPLHHTHQERNDSGSSVDDVNVPARVSYADAREGHQSLSAAATTAGPWRTLDELAGSEHFEQVVANEFPRYAPSEWDDGPSRRSFLQLAGASVGLAGLTACTRQPREKIVPYVEQPEFVVPGKPTYYATSMTLGGVGQPLLAESHMGRPTKVSGNPDHPAASNSAGLFAEASILGLYDPDRSRGLQFGGRETDWQTFVEQMRAPMKAQEALGGTGLRILTGAVSSPTLVDQINRLRERFPQAKWVQYEAVNNDAGIAASRAAFGSVLHTIYDLSKADVIVSLDSEFLSSGPGYTKLAADFAARRQVIHEDGDSGSGDSGHGDSGKGEEAEAGHGAAVAVNMNRLYALECVPGATGSVADHRIGVSPVDLGKFAAALAAQLVGGLQATAIGGELQRWVDEVAKDLTAHAGASVVIPGQFASSAVHVMAHAINAALDNVGVTVSYQEPPVAEPTSNSAALAELVADMNSGSVDLLVVLGANPVYDAAGDLDFASAMEKVAVRVHGGLHEDETRYFCQWHIPMAHYLEGWSDCRSFDGTVGLQQPLIEPLFGGKTEAEMIAGLLGEPADGYQLVRASWQARLGAADFESAWRKALHDGYLEGSQSPVVSASLSTTAVADAAATLASKTADGLTVIVRPDPSLYDGRFANNAWLQELPKTITKVCWDQVALVAPATMERLGFEPNTKIERVIQVQVNGRSIELPILLSIGQAHDTVVIAMGHGRTRAGSVGNRKENGANVQVLRAADSGYDLYGAEIVDTGREYKVAATQEHFQIGVQAAQAAGRHLVKQGTVDQYAKNPHFAAHLGAHVPQNVSLFPDWDYPGYAWGMAINLSTCTGCNACLMACQAENNIPVVGRDQVVRGREMHWLRIDRYYEGDPESPKIHHQPVACMHCERAPCELVCPVGATTHSDEGLNDMAYNRCIGTRYCSNNCPYKVRRFNFLKYNDTTTPILKLARNPDVSIRTRGVMEKCTYCTQRISKARIQAQVEDRKIQDGEITTACQEACPTGAIVFGDINDAQSEVARWKRSGLNYQLLEELAVEPRTTYLAKLTNPNPALMPQASRDEAVAEH